MLLLCLIHCSNLTPHHRKIGIANTDMTARAAMSVIIMSICEISILVHFRYLALRDLGMAGTTLRTRMEA
jgi:hypothetical protein